MTRPAKTKQPKRRRWKLELEEVPVELRDNFIVQHLLELTPEEEADIEAAERLDEAETAKPTGTA
ncbi:MAG: hypothetical protein KC619_35765 [Myxococcales bacterium]|nr:hypothetical protein [Myxococcales bacterium]